MAGWVYLKVHRDLAASGQVDGTLQRITGQLAQERGTLVLAAGLQENQQIFPSHDFQLRRGFERVGLKAGETKTVHFVIPSEGLSLLNRDMKRVVEPGEFKVMVGASSEDIRLEGTFVVQ